MFLRHMRKRAYAWPLPWLPIAWTTTLEGSADELPGTPAWTSPTWAKL